MTPNIVFFVEIEVNALVSTTFNTYASQENIHKYITDCVF